MVARDIDDGTSTVLAHAGNGMGCVRTLAVSGDGRSALFGADAPGVVPTDHRDPRQSDIFVAEPLR